MLCRLCLKENGLCDSHIIPEFLYKPSYDEKHRMLVMNLNPPQGTSYLQKGFREKLLCKDCEQILNLNYESYFNNIWYEKGYKPRKITKKHITLPGIDYAKFKLFLLSILWRASVSSLSTFSGINIGSHEEILRIKLLNQEAGDESDYPILPQFILLPQSYQVLDGFIIAPITETIQSKKVVLFVFGGCSWFYFFDPILDKGQYPLSQNGKVTFGVKPFEEIRILTEPFMEMINKGFI